MTDPEPLRSFIRRDFLFDRDAELRDDQELFPNVIDSLGVTELVAFIEETYGIEIPDDQLTADNFRTLDAIVALVRANTP
jgi:acyl carrier protein